MNSANDNPLIKPNFEGLYVKMNENNTQGAVVALLAEYEKALKELQQVIADIPPAQLTTMVDTQTANPDCRSIQTILTHVVSSGYSYCVYIQNLRDKSVQRPPKIERFSVTDYTSDLNEVLKFTQATLANIQDTELEELETSKQINTSWGKLYDIEQLMEHAIVHILRHRRQIEKFKRLLEG